MKIFVFLNENSFQLIQSNGGLKRLMQFVQDSVVPAVQAAAAKAIARAARKRKIKQRFRMKFSEIGKTKDCI